MRFGGYEVVRLYGYTVLRPIGQIELIIYKAYDFNYRRTKVALTPLTTLTTTSLLVDARLMTLTTKRAKRVITSSNSFNY